MPAPRSSSRRSRPTRRRGSRRARSTEEHAPFVEVYVATSLEECARRDPKGLYAKAHAGEIPEFTGVSDPYEEPRAPELRLETEGRTPEESAAARPRAARGARPGRRRGARHDAPTVVAPFTLSHLDELESEAIHIMREVAAERERPVLLFSGGKDSIVLLRLAEKAFRPGGFPFPVMHVDTGHNFPEVIEFRDRRVAELGERLVVASVQESIDKGRVVEQTGPRASRNQLQTTTLLDAIEEHGFDAAMGGARRDEERARAKERIFSFRDDFGQWNPRAQRPELWNLYNGRIRKGEQIRVFPISNWTELDVWQYIAREQLELPSIYFAHERRGLPPRRDALRRLRLRRAAAGRGARSRAWVRFRTVGDMTLHRRRRVARRDDRRGRHRDRRDATSPSAARPAPTTASPKRRWKTASATGTSDGHVRADDAVRAPPARDRGLGGRRQVDAARPAALRHEADPRRPARAHRGDLAAPRRRLRQPGAPHRRPAGRARAGDHDRRRLPLVRHPAPPLPARRRARPRPVHAQHGHGRLDRRRRGDPPRRPQRHRRADAPALLHRGDAGASRTSWSR